MSARPDACAPNLERRPATERGFCHPGPGFRRSFAPSPREGEGARPSRFRELFAPVRSRPRVVRRLLPTRRSASTTIGRSTPGLAYDNLTYAGRRSMPVRGSFLSHLRLTGAARGPRSRGLSGQGPCCVDSRSRAPRQAPSSRDGSQWRLRPNPMWLGHLVSRLRSPPDWSRRGDARCANEPSIFISWVRPARPLARSVERAASHTSPRREDAIRCTRDAFRPKIPLAGGLSPQVVPNLWMMGLVPLRSPFLFAHERC